MKIRFNRTQPKSLQNPEAMKKLLFFLLSLLLVSCNVLTKQGRPETGKVIDASVKKDNGQWVQRHEIVVEGTIEEVWNYYADNQELATHVAPIIEVELKNGGKWEASYNLKAKIGDPNNFINEVINVIPFEQFTTKGVRVPKGLYRDEAMQALRATMKFEEAGKGKVKVSAILTGWGQIEDEEYREKAWQMAGAFNPEILKCLFVRMTQGPLDWEKVLSRN